MLLRNNKFKSFGIIEAVIASAIVVILISGAVSLSSSSLRSSSLNTAYFESEHIADDLMEQIYSAKSAGKLYFDSRDIVSTDTLFPIDCFDTSYWRSSCDGVISAGAELPYNTDTIFSGALGSEYVDVGKDDISPAFPDVFYSWKISINKPSEMQPPISGCRSVSDSGNAIPEEKCRFAQIDIKWNESSGEKHYYLTQYFADWER